MSDIPVFSLADVLATLPLPDDVAGLKGLSSKWRCVLAPHIAAGAEEEEEILRRLDTDAMPVFLPRSRATGAYEGSGPDALQFVQDERWNRFPKPQIAVRGGWGSPGTTLESSEYHKLIGAFDEVFHHKAAVELPLTEEERQKEAEAKAAEDQDPDKEAALEERKTQMEEQQFGEVLEMQLFHRDDPQSCPQLPPLGNELKWPSFLDEASSVICDVDTIISQRGARRWWRLNDCGELVMQAALPLSAELPQQLSHGHSPETAAILKAIYSQDYTKETPRRPVKLLIFGPKGSYDWFIHDDESSVRGRIACLDLFNTPDEALPLDASLLPVLTVAVLEAGGDPLLIPPNLPCLSLTLQDSVVVEQRRVSHTLWLDELSYMLHRTSHWASAPLIYEYVEKDLQDAQYVASDLIPALMALFRRHNASHPYERRIRRRIALSLLSIALNEKHYQLEEGTRASLLQHLRTNEEFCTILETPTGSATTSDAACAPYCFLSPEGATLEASVVLYWSTKAWWPKAGCVLKAPLRAADAFHYSDTVKSSAEWFLPVVYHQFRPIYGTEKKTLEETVAEYFDMKELDKKPRELLLTYLRSRKQQKDDLLDELF